VLTLIPKESLRMAASVLGSEQFFKFLLQWLPHLNFAKIHTFLLLSLFFPYFKLYCLLEDLKNIFLWI
jgi:hypothetical protein